MIEVTNRQRSPVQLIIRSRRHPNAFTTKNVPGVGGGKNVVWIADELTTEYVERLARTGFITTRQVNTEQEGV